MSELELEILGELNSGAQVIARTVVPESFRGGRLQFVVVERFDQKLKIGDPDIRRVLAELDVAQGETERSFTIPHGLPAAYAHERIGWRYEMVLMGDRTGPDATLRQPVDIAPSWRTGINHGARYASSGPIGKRLTSHAAIYDRLESHGFQTRRPSWWRPVAALLTVVMVFGGCAGVLASGQPEDPDTQSTVLIVSLFVIACGAVPAFEWKRGVVPTIRLKDRIVDAGAELVVDVHPLPPGEVELRFVCREFGYSPRSERGSPQRGYGVLHRATVHAESVPVTGRRTTVTTPRTSHEGFPGIHVAKHWILEVARAGGGRVFARRVIDIVPVADRAIGPAGLDRSDQEP